MESRDKDPTEPDPTENTEPGEEPTEPQGEVPRQAGPPPPDGPQSPAPEAPTAAQGSSQTGASGTAPRRLTRSRGDRMIAGVCGGIARYFGIDATLVRIATVVLTAFGGAGALLYVAGLVLMPADDAPAAGTATPTGRPTALTIAGVVVLALIVAPLMFGVAGVAVPLAVLVLAGLLVWWLVSGQAPSDGSAADIAKRAALGIGVLIACGLVAAGGGLAAGLGGGTAVAWLVILAGVLLVAGAFIGGARWLILPALSLALAVGFVSAAGIDLHGGVGEREYEPTSAGEVRDGYRLGMGELIVDLRGADLPAGDTRLDLDVGIGAARLIVPEDVCVASAAEIGIGAVDVFDREHGGVDVDWDDRPRTASDGSRVVVDADIGVGALLVRHDRTNDFEHGAHFGRDFRDDEESDGSIGNVGCEGARAAR